MGSYEVMARRSDDGEKLLQYNSGLLLPYSKIQRIPRETTFHHLDVKKINIKKQMNLGAHVHSHLWKGAEH